MNQALTVSVGADAHIGPSAERNSFSPEDAFVAFGHWDDVGIVPYEGTQILLGIGH